MPHISEHGKPYVYLTKNPVIAAFYSVHPVDKPYSWYPYGYDENGTPVYTEAYPNALYDVYGKKTGWIYQVDDWNDQCLLEDTGAFVTNRPLPVKECLMMADVYEALLAYESQGKLVIHRYDAQSVEQQKRWNSLVLEEIEKYGLRKKPDDPYSKFIKQRFPTLW